MKTLKDILETIALARVLIGAFVSWVKKTLER